MAVESPTADAVPKWGDITAFQRDLLVAIARLERDGETSYGLAIKRAVERQYGEEINHGRLYPNLDELVEHGLVEKGQIDRRTNEYVLTDGGRALLIQRVEALADIVDIPIVVSDGGDA